MREILLHFEEKENERKNRSGNFHVDKIHCDTIIGNVMLALNITIRQIHSQCNKHFWFT